MKIVPLHDVVTVEFGIGEFGQQVAACYLDGERVTNPGKRIFCQVMNVKEGWVDVLEFVGNQPVYTRRYGVVTYDLRKSD